MTAQILTLADEVVTRLNSHGFGRPFTAERGYLPTFELPDLNVLRVTVVPKEDQGRLDTRRSSSHELTLDLGIQQKPATFDHAALDPLVALTQEIADFFLFGQSPAGTSLIAPTIRVLFLPEHLQKFRQFTSVVTLGFRGWREAA